VAGATWAESQPASVLQAAVNQFDVPVTGPCDATITGLCKQLAAQALPTAKVLTDHPDFAIGFARGIGQTWCNVLDAHWSDFKATYLKANPSCAACLAAVEAGKKKPEDVKPATEVHAAQVGYVGLCEACHGAKPGRNMHGIWR